MATEVKSLRINTGSIKEAYITEKKNELWLTNCHIKKYSSSNEKNYNPSKERKILVKKKEKNKLIGAIKMGGMSIIPLSLYFNNKGNWQYLNTGRPTGIENESNHCVPTISRKLIGIIPAKKGMDKKK